MKKFMMIAAMIAVFGLGSAAAFAATSDKPPSSPGQDANDQVCPDGDTGKIDVSGSQASVTVTAPEGKLISGYCVKAGSANQGDGPVLVTVNPPQATVTITHPSGKDISHYSVTYVVEETPPTETTPTDTTPTDTTPTDTTPTNTTPMDTTPMDTTPTESSPTETTATETTATETPSSPQEQSHVFTPPISQEPAQSQPISQKPAQGQPASVAGAGAIARPSKAPQLAPFTP